ncbi:pyridoxamine 5'-phosphate oxidase family protein [Microbacterium profundi]|uniref:pyridoxamine 5'-phosphate oxidase family protein n=1 Tax=Microbacterium profundi TaxID=450380 RepID=UPI001F466C26|nr:pyridoxamine 5'-phosphate oxidase family protein [Microbacterium profundi]MCE7483366.1 pyridoxamine 5'-phosphate oxidase family protein [Microbacterium profundi]
MEAEKIKELSVDECWALLSTAVFGRIAVSIAGHPDIFPVNYVAGEGKLTFRTSEGTKLFGVTVNESVAFEVDDHTETEGWSIVVKGTARTLQSESEIAEAETLQLRPWIPTVKRNFVRIDVNDITGRRFIFGPEPDRVDTPS